MRPDELQRRRRKRLDALGPAPRAELLHVLMLPDFERVDRIGSYWGARRRDLDVEAALLALGPGMVDAFPYQESETV